MFGKKKKDKVERKKPAMKLTTREKVMLIILGIMGFSAFSYFVVWTPQTEKLETLEAQAQELELKIQENNLMLSQEKNIDESYREARQKQKVVAKKYFEKLDQPSIIYKMNDLLFSDSISFPTYSFYSPQTEDINDFQVKSMNIGLPFDGSYSAIMDTLKKLNNNPQKIIVEDISIQRDEAQRSLSGNMNVRFYSLDGILAESEILEEDSPSEVVATPITDTKEKVEEEDDDEKAPFLEKEATTTTTSTPNAVDAKAVVAEKSPFGAFLSKEEEEGEDGEEKVELDPMITTKLLSFNQGSYYFLPSHDLVKGSTRIVNKGREGKSLRVEYDMIAIENENYALIDFSDNPISLSVPPDNLTMWVFSYDYSPVTLGVETENQRGEKGRYPIGESGINWTGWRQVAFEITDDINHYPLEVNKFFITMPDGSEGSGVLLLDELEINYQRNIDEEGNDASIEPYTTYVVEYGDTFESISRKIYGSPKYAREIKNINEIKGNRLPEVGQVLVLRRR